MADLKLGNKVGFTVSIICFVNICTYGCRRTLQLVDKRIVTFYAVTHFDDFNRKICG